MQNSDKKTTSVRYFTIGADEVGQRVDNYLVAYARSVPKSHIYRVIRTGQVRVNGGRTKPTYRLRENDSVRIPPLVTKKHTSVQVPDAFIDELEARVNFENDEIICLDKPAGVAVHAGSGLHFGVIEALRQSRKGGGKRLELVHRLDRGTSGCLLVAKSRVAATHYQALFRRRLVEKNYNALLCGHWPSGTTTVTAPLVSNKEHAGERRVAIAEYGKEAISHITLLRKLGNYSEVDIQIETGRTHQIRVHTAHMGHPIVGDQKYGRSLDTSRHRQAGLRRMYLHCSRIAFARDSKFVFQISPDVQWQDDLSKIDIA